MEKIRIMQNAVTFVSGLTVDEIKMLQAQNPMALAIKEPNADGGEDIVFMVEYKKTPYGTVSNEKITFVDKTAEGKACTTVLIPATEKDKAGYLYSKYAVAVNMLKAVERRAKYALEHLTTSKTKFVEEFINLDAEAQLAETLDEAEAIVKAVPAECNCGPVDCECDPAECKCQKNETK